MIFVIVLVPILVPAAFQCHASTSHPPAATALHNHCRLHHPCPCSCPRRLSTSRVDNASSHRHCFARLLSSSLLSPPPAPRAIIVVVPIACRCQRQSRILPLPPPPCAIIVIVIVVPDFLPTAGRRRRCILPPPLPRGIVFVPAFLPAAGQRRASCININIASYRCHHQFVICQVQITVGVAE
jgi:hypothetical protein